MRGMRTALGLMVLATFTIGVSGCDGESQASGGAGGDDRSSGGAGGSATGGSAEGAGPEGGSAEGGGGEGGAGGSGPSADEACGSFASALCALRDECSDGHFIDINYGEIATCMARQKEQCLLRLDADDSSLSAESTAACAAGYATFSCDALLNGELPAGCGQMPGARADGEVCVFGGQCASAFCESSADQACGVCAPAPVAGTSCADDTGCGAGSGLRCDDLTASCLVPGGAGDECDGPAQCRSGLSCVGATDTASGLCEIAGTSVGDVCHGQGVGAPDCERSLGLRCLQGACVHVEYAADGEACGVLADGVSVCSANGQCLGPASDKTCVEAVADGQACDTELGPPCQTPAGCMTDGVSSAGVCALSDAAVCE